MASKTLWMIVVWVLGESQTMNNAIGRAPRTEGHIVAYLERFLYANVCPRLSAGLIEIQAPDRSREVGGVRSSAYITLLGRYE